MTVYRSYVAIGDSLSEGLGDFEFDIKRERAGWTDRLAALLAKQAETNGHEFHYANLAIRGSKLPEIMSKQLEAALSLKPDLVTVMAGANDLMKSYKKYPELERQLFEGIRKLQDAGCHVLVANTLNPLHLRVFKAMATRAVVMTNLIERTAAALNAPVLDVFRIDSLKELCFWAEDMVHFSGHGHARVANRAADVLELDYRHQEAAADEMTAPARGLYATLRWVVLHVLPFFSRKIRRVSSGNGIEPKYPRLVKFVADEGDFRLLHRAEINRVAELRELVAA
jgi:lysophospholipase L1-like esterase